MIEEKFLILENQLTKTQYIILLELLSPVILNKNLTTATQIKYDFKKLPSNLFSVLISYADNSLSTYTDCIVNALNEIAMSTLKINDSSCQFSIIQNYKLDTTNLVLNFNLNPIFITQIIL